MDLARACPDASQHGGLAQLLISLIVHQVITKCTAFEEISFTFCKVCGDE